MYSAVAVLAAAVMSCGESDRESKPADAAAPRALTALEAEVYAELAYPALGQTDTERRCWAPVLAQGAKTVDEALDKTAPFDGPGAALLALAPHCTTEARAGELDAAYDDYERELVGDDASNS